MADKAKVQDGDYIEMDVSIAGDNLSWSPGQVLRVGTDIDASTAQAFVTSYDGDDPRARVVSEERALQQLSHDEGQEPMRTEEPPAERTEPTTEVTDEADELDERLRPVFAAIADDQHGILLEEGQREAAAAFVEAHPDDERSAVLTQLLAKDDGGEDGVEQRNDEQGDEQGQQETAISTQAEKRETAVVKRGKRTVTPPETAEDNKD